MSPKRKIPSRKLQSRKFASTKPGSRDSQSSPPVKRWSKPPATKSSTARTSTEKPASASKPKPPMKPVPAEPQPTVPQCLWDMGFERLPTMEELRQRYKELSLVLHPDAGGSKQAFQSLRANYESAQSLLGGAL